MHENTYQSSIHFICFKQFFLQYLLVQIVCIFGANGLKTCPDVTPHSMVKCETD